MNLKITNSNNTKKDEVSSYPCLKIITNGSNVENNTVILFSREGCGVVIDNSLVNSEYIPTYYVGYYSTSWREEKFAPFKGTITFTQE